VENNKTKVYDINKNIKESKIFVINRTTNRTCSI